MFLPMPWSIGVLCIIALVIFDIFALIMFIAICICKVEHEVNHMKDEDSSVSFYASEKDCPHLLKDNSNKAAAVMTKEEIRKIRIW